MLFELNIKNMKIRHVIESHMLLSIYSLLTYFALGILGFSLVFITQIVHPIDIETSSLRSQKTFTFTGIRNSEWCLPPVEEPLPFDKCRHSDTIFRIGVHGGLTNAIHFILKGAIWAFEEEMCLFVDKIEPQGSKMAERETPEGNINPFLSRYFELIGLPVDSDLVQKAKNQHNFFDVGYHQIQFHEYGKHSGGLQIENYPDRQKLRDIQPLELYQKDNIWLKKYILRRLIRFRAEQRNQACERLAVHDLTDEYIALSVRRGDKALEYGVEASMNPYIEKAEMAIKTHFGGRVPMIYVASDDCTVMNDFRSLRPNWKFISECDKAQDASSGFVIDEMKYWTLKQTDQHYQKFIAELIAMASAKFWIGVSTTNVSLFVYWMRQYDQRDDSWVFVDSDDFVH